MDVAELTPDTTSVSTADAWPVPGADAVRGPRPRTARRHRRPVRPSSAAEPRRDCGWSAGGELFDAQVDEPAPGLRGPRAAGGGARLLHHRLRRARVQRAVALAPRPTDPALLHYRSGGFYCRPRGPGARVDPVRDVLQGLMGCADEPIAGGRHKVFGHPALAVIPQTSTIASHLPRAVGLAIALHRAHRLGVTSPWPRRRGGGLLLRRRLGQPLDRRRGDQHRTQHRLPRAPGPDPLRLRGQRAGGSRCRPRPAGSRRRTAHARAWPTCPPTAPTRATAWHVIAEARRAWLAAADGRSSCTCGPCGSWAMRAATPRSATASPRRSSADYRPRPDPGDRRGSRQRWRSHRRTTSSPATTSSASEVDDEVGAAGRRAAAAVRRPR